jgi:hypothetical protein
MHAELVHETAELHWPVAEHVWTPLPEHCVAPGTHTPMHAPVTQADATHEEAAPHWPLELQVSTPLPEQRVVPGAHTPEHSPPTQA